MELVIVGSVGLDNVQTPAGKVTEVIGGSAMYASMAARHFCRTKFVGVVGDDFPDGYINLLKINGINIDGLQKVKGKTFRWGGVYNDLNKAETLFTDLNVFADFNPVLPPSYKSSPFLFLGNIDPVLQLNVLKQMDSPKITACDTMNYWITGKKAELLKVIEKIDILFINEDEVKMLTGEYNIYKAIRQALALGPELVVVKRGEYGSMVGTDNFMAFAPVFPLEDVVDPTGAGDSFAGGFMGYIAKVGNLEKNTVKKAMIYGTVMASVNIEAFSIDNLCKADIDLLESRVNYIKELVKFE